MRKLPAVFGIAAMILAAFLFASHSKNVSASTAHLVISEIQIAGATSSDEFVELYNPTENAMDLSQWTLSRKTALGTTEILIATGSGTIPAHGFYLFANTGFDGGVTPDKTYTENIAPDNTVILRDNIGNLVDMVGMGAAGTKEGSTIDNPIANRSVERKANSGSTELSMSSGGTDEMLGNGEDTDNNSNDFVRHASPHLSLPQNSLSPIEPVAATFTLTPSLSPTPTLEPTATPTEEPTPTPTQEPSPTLSPSPEPTVTPSPSPEPSPIPSPTPVPSSTPTPTTQVTSTPTPTVTPIVSSPTPTLMPSPTPTPGGTVIVNSPHLVCYLTKKQVDFFFFKISIPVINCVRI